MILLFCLTDSVERFDPYLRCIPYFMTLFLFLRRSFLTAIQNFTFVTGWRYLFRSILHKFFVCSCSVYHTFWAFVVTQFGFRCIPHRSPRVTFVPRCVPTVRLFVQPYAIVLWTWWFRCSDAGRFAVVSTWRVDLLLLFFIVRWIFICSNYHLFSAFGYNHRLHLCWTFIRVQAFDFLHYRDAIRCLNSKTFTAGAAFPISPYHTISRWCCYRCRAHIAISLFLPVVCSLRSGRWPIWSFSFRCSFWTLHYRSTVRLEHSLHRRYEPHLLRSTLPFPTVVVDGIPDALFHSTVGWTFYVVVLPPLFPHLGVVLMRDASIRSRPTARFRCHFAYSPVPIVPIILFVLYTYVTTFVVLVDLRFVPGTYIPLYRYRRFATFVRSVLRFHSCLFSLVFAQFDSDSPYLILRRSTYHYICISVCCFVVPTVTAFSLLLPRPFLTTIPLFGYCCTVNPIRTHWPSTLPFHFRCSVSIFFGVCSFVPFVDLRWALVWPVSWTLQRYISTFHAEPHLIVLFYTTFQVNSVTLNPFRLLQRLLRSRCLNVRCLTRYVFIFWFFVGVWLFVIALFVAFDFATVLDVVPIHSIPFLTFPQFRSPIIYHDTVVTAPAFVCDTTCFTDVFRYILRLFTRWFFRFGIRSHFITLPLLYVRFSLKFCSAFRRFAMGVTGRPWCDHYPLLHAALRWRVTGYSTTPTLPTCWHWFVPVTVRSSRCPVSSDRLFPTAVCCPVTDRGLRVSADFVVVPWFHTMTLIPFL